jgi:hypothetical protein
LSALDSTERRKYLRGELISDLEAWQEFEPYREVREKARQWPGTPRAAARYEVTLGRQYRVVWVQDFGDEVQVLSNVSGDLETFAIPRSRWNKDLRAMLEARAMDLETAVAERMWDGSLYLVSVCDGGKWNQFGVYTPIPLRSLERKHMPELFALLERPSRIIQILREIGSPEGAKRSECVDPGGLEVDPGAAK